LATPNVVDQDVDPAVLVGGDRLDQAADLVDVHVVNLFGDSVASGSGHELCGFLDCFRSGQ
jgi:hypothetical protein